MLTCTRTRTSPCAISVRTFTSSPCSSNSHRDDNSEVLNGGLRPHEGPKINSRGRLKTYLTVFKSLNLLIKTFNVINRNLVVDYSCLPLGRWRYKDKAFFLVNLFGKKFCLNISHLH